MQKPWYVGQKAFLPYLAPLLGGVLVAVAIAFFLVQEIWFLAVALAFAVPVAVLLNRYPFVAIMLWILILPLFPPVPGNRYLYWAVHQGLMPLALGINLVSRMLRLKEHPPVRLNLADLVVVLYISMAILTILFNKDISSDTATYARTLYNRTGVAFVGYWLVRFLHVEEKDWLRLIPLFLFLTLLEGVVGLLSWFVPEVLPAMWHSRDGLLGARVTGTFSEPGAYTAALMFFMIFLFQYAMTKARSRAGRAFLLAIFGFGLVCIFFSFSRGSWLAALVVLLIILYLYPRPVLILVGLTLPLMFLLAMGPLSNEFAWAMQRLETEQTVESRMVLAHAGKKMFLAKPIFGWGYGSYDLYDWRFIERLDNIAPTRWDLEKGTSHNSYLTILAETGMVGLLLYVFPVLWWFGLTVRKFRHVPVGGFWDRRLLILMWAFILFYALITQFFDIRFFWFTQGTAWLVLGLIALTLQRSEKGSDALV
ncbi:MAG: O-antigen ligase family protein [Caldilineae bacterium]|nr:MAG: O-antigen ligase family protein [Caldilineae bacterium]